MSSSSTTTRTRPSRWRTTCASSRAVRVCGVDWTRVRPWVGTAARLLLGGIWIWAALSKLRDPLTFTQAVRAYDATPEWLSKAIGYGLPVLELALGVLLILGITVRIAAAISAALF